MSSGAPEGYSAAPGRPVLLTRHAGPGGIERSGRGVRHHFTSRAGKCRAPVRRDPVSRAGMCHVPVSPDSDHAMPNSMTRLPVRASSFVIFFFSCQPTFTAYEFEPSGTPRTAIGKAHLAKAS